MVVSGIILIDGLYSAMGITGCSILCMVLPALTATDLAHSRHQSNPFIYIVPY